MEGEGPLDPVLLKVLVGSMVVLTGFLLIVLTSAAEDASHKTSMRTELHVGSNPHKVRVPVSNGGSIATAYWYILRETLVSLPVVGDLYLRLTRS